MPDLRSALLLFSVVIACGAADDPSQDDGPDPSSHDTTDESGGMEPLFNEAGAWSLVEFDVGEGLQEVMQTTRRDAFMLDFDADAHVMTTAACGDEMNGFGPTDSTCRLSPSTTAWQCRCFSYAFEQDVMQMVEFTAGSPPPEVAFDPDATSDMSLTVATASLVPERADTIEIRPLPAGVFGGDSNSSFVVEARSMVTFEETYADPDGRPSCAPCVP